MSSATASFNATIISKLSWMSRQLRRINDVNALMNWVNAMHSVKALLFPLPSEHCCPGTANHKTSETPDLSSLPSHYLAQTVNPLPSASDSVPPQRPQLINYPQTLQRSTSFQLGCPPSKEFLEPLPRHTRSTSLQLSSLLNVSIPPSLETNFKVATSGSVPIDEATGTTRCPRLVDTFENKTIQHLQTAAEIHLRKNEHSDSKKLLPGKHIWYGMNPRDPKLKVWAFHKFTPSDEYEILQRHISENMVTVKRLKTGVTYKIRFLEKLRLKSSS